MRECVDCGTEFDLSPGEKRFFEEKGLTLPKRCKDCRVKRKEEKQRGRGRSSAPARREDPEPRSIVLARADFEDLIRDRRISWRLGKSMVDVILADIGDEVILEIVERYVRQAKA